MKKVNIKLFLSLLLVVALTVRVNAALVCNPESGDTTIVETEINDAGFDATLPICKWTRIEGSWSPMDNYYGSYTEAYESGYETEVTYSQTLDAKDYYKRTVPRCSYTDRKVRANIICPLTKKTGNCADITSETKCKTY